MPIALYRGISDHDLAAIIAYLRAVPPIHNAVTQHSSYPFPIDPLGPPVEHIADPADNPIARGAYIAGPLAHCIECHAPPLSVVQRDWSRSGAGGMPIEGPWGIVVAPNITPDKEHGIGNWTDQQIRDALTKGVTPDGHNCCRRWAPALRSIPKSARTICATSSLTCGHFLRSSRMRRRRCCSGHYWHPVRSPCARWTDGRHSPRSRLFNALTLLGDAITSPRRRSPLRQFPPTTRHNVWPAGESLRVGRRADAVSLCGPSPVAELTMLEHPDTVDALQRRPPTRSQNRGSNGQHDWRLSVWTGAVHSDRES